MNKLTISIKYFLSALNSWRDKWVQSQIKAYLIDFKKRTDEHKEYWFEKMFLPIINREITTAPNLISIFRGLMALPLLIFIFDQRYGLSLAFFIFIMLLDAIDGPLAKVLNQQSDLGEILDPMGDKLAFAVVFLTLGEIYIRPWLFIGTIFIEMIIVIMALLLRPIGKKLNLNFKKKATIWGKVKLNLQVIGCGLMLIQRMDITSTVYFTNSIFTICLLLSMISIIEYFKSIKRTTL